MPLATPARLEDLLGWRLSVAGRLMRARADARMGAAAGAQGVGVLMRLLEGDGIAQGALARLQRVEPPSMCRMVDRLERDGLVERRPSPDDRRATLVHLTAAGRAAAEAGAAAAAALDEEVFAVLSARERAALAEMLGRAMGALGGEGTR